MASSQALLWIQNWCFPYRLFDRLTESSGWAVHKHIYCQASSLSNWKLRNRDIRIASSCPSEQLCEDPQGPGFLGHFTCSKHKSCWCPLWLCTSSISAAQIPGSYLGKISVRNRQFGVSHNKLAWKGLAGWTVGSWQQPRVKQVLQCGIHCSICLPSNFCYKWAKVLQKPLPSLHSTQLITSKRAGTHRSETKADVCSLGEVP